MTPEQLADAIIGMFVDYEPERHQARRDGTIWMIQDALAAAEAAAYERAARKHALFAVLLVRLIEDELSRDIETGLLDQCLRAVRAELLTELDRRIVGLPSDRVHTLAHLRRYAAAIRALK